MRTLRFALLFLVAIPQVTGRLEIIVLDGNTRQGVPGVPVIVTFKFPLEPAGSAMTHLTDPRGLAVFSALATGNYVVKLGEGYNPAAPFTDYVWIDPGDQKRVEVTVNRIAKVSLRILDADGTPIRSALVRLPGLTYRNGVKTLREVPLSRHENSGDGVFVVSGIPPGDYYLKIEHPESLTKQEGLEIFPLVTYYPGVTNLSNAAKITLRGQDIYLGDIRLPRHRGFKVSGTLFNPFAGRTASFYVGPADPSSPEEPTRPPEVHFGTPTSSKEIPFEIGGLLQGTYALYTVLSDSSVTNKTIVAIKDRDVDGVTIVLKEPTRISAKLVVDGDGGMANDLRVALRIRERLPAPAEFGTNMTTPFTVDPKAGAFTFVPLTENTRYDVTVAGLPPDAYVADVRVGVLSILDEGTFIASSDLLPLQIQIGTKGGVIQGVVRDPTGQAATNATVIVIPDLTRRKNSFLYKRGNSDRDGRFIMRGLAPGEYRVFALSTTPPDGAEEDPEFFSVFEGRSTTVNAMPGVTTETLLQVIQ